MEVIGDAAYLGMGKRESADPELVTYAAAKRYSRRKKRPKDKLAQKKRLNSIKCKVDRAINRIRI